MYFPMVRDKIIKPARRRTDNHGDRLAIVKVCLSQDALYDAKVKKQNSAKNNGAHYFQQDKVSSAHYSITPILQYSNTPIPQLFNSSTPSA